MSSFRSVFRLLKEMTAFPFLFTGCLICLLLVNLLALSRPLLIAYLLNHYLQEDMEKIQQGCILIMVLLMGESLLTYLMGYGLSVLGQNIIQALRKRVYGHVMNMSSSWFDKTPVGTLITRCVSDIEAMNEVFTQGLLQVGGDLLMILLLIGAMIYKNFFLSIGIGAVLPLLIVATSVFRKGVRISFIKVRDAVARLNIFIQERLNGMAWIKAFGVQSREMEKFRDLNRDYRDANIRTIFYYSVFFPVMDLLTSVALAMVLYLGFFQRSEGGVPVGDLAFFIMITQMLFRPIRLLADRLNTLQMGLVASERVYALLDHHESLEKNGTFILQNFSENIRYEQVSFSYNTEVPVLRDVSFEIKKGEKIGIIGRTGSGKSTLVQLLGGLTNDYRGKILIDGIELRSIEKNSLRKKIFILLQDVFLFNDTLLENIRFYDSSVSRERVQEVVRELELEDFINQFTGGLDYVIQERGSGLSSGQKQLVAFLRARILDPEVFVFDEATSFLDAKTEHYLQKAMNKVMKDKTAIIIAHRLSTVMQCHGLLILENGQIAESGTPQELVQKKVSFFSEELYLQE